MGYQSRQLLGPLHETQQCHISRRGDRDALSRHGRPYAAYRTLLNFGIVVKWQESVHGLLLWSVNQARLRSRRRGGRSSRYHLTRVTAGGGGAVFLVLCKCDASVTSLNQSTLTTGQASCCGWKTITPRIKRFDRMYITVC